MADRFPTDEQHHGYNNRTLYGAAKLFNEGMLRSFNEQYGLEYVALRYFNVYGPRMDTHGAYTEVFIRWMENIEQGRAPVIFGDGTQTMDFVYVEDIARANLMAARAPVSDTVYNVASGSEISLRDCADVMLSAMGRSSIPIEYAPARKVNPVPRRLADAWQAQQEIGFQTLVPFDEGVEKLVAWWRQQTVAVALA
jgi:UDP-glucose 4-epimerase